MISMEAKFSCKHLLRDSVPDAAYAAAAETCTQKQACCEQAWQSLDLSCYF